MAVYVIATVLMKEGADGNTEVRPFMKVILMNMSGVEQEAVDFMRSEFVDSPQAAEGWTMSDAEPVMFDIHEGHYEKWRDMIGPAPQVAPARSHLRVVD